MSLKAIIYSIKTSDRTFGIAATVGPGFVYLIKHVFIFIYLLIYILFIDVLLIMGMIVCMK